MTNRLSSWVFPAFHGRYVDVFACAAEAPPREADGPAPDALRFILCRQRSPLEEVSGSARTRDCRTTVYLSAGPIRQNDTVSVTETCAIRPDAAASVSRRRRERRSLLAVSGRHASRSHTLAAKQPLSACICILSDGSKTKVHRSTRRYQLVAIHALVPHALPLPLVHV